MACVSCCSHLRPRLPEQGLCGAGEGKHLRAPDLRGYRGAEGVQGAGGRLTRSSSSTHHVPEAQRQVDPALSSRGFG